MKLSNEMEVFLSLFQKKSRENSESKSSLGVTGTKNQDSLALFFQELKKCPMLSPEKEKEAFERFFNGSELEKKEAFETLVKSNLRLVAKLAKKFIGCGLELNHLIQAGIQGLIRSIEKFDPQRNCKLSTWATKVIRSFIFRELDNQARSVRLPVNVLADIRRIGRAVSKHHSTTGQPANIDKIHGDTGLSKKRIQKAWEAVRLQASIRQAQTSQETGIKSLSEVANDTLNPLDALIRLETINAISEAITKLPREEAAVLEGRFPQSGREVPWKKVADSLNKTVREVRWLMERAIRRLRTQLKPTL